MKSFIVILLVGTLFSYPLENCYAEGVNLVKNPGFESTVESWTIADWTMPLDSRGNVSIDTTQSKTGDRCLRLKAKGGKKIRCSTVIPVVPNKEYLLSLYVKPVSVDKDGTWATLYALDKNAEWIGGWLLVNNNTNLLSDDGTHDWERKEILIPKGSLPEGTVKVGLQIKIGSSEGEVYYDDISLTRKGSDINLIKNFSFEVPSFYNIWPEVWDINWWIIYENKPISRIVVDDEVYHSGKYSLKMEGNNDSGIATQRVDRNKPMGGRYKISSWVKTSNLNTQAKIDLDFRKTKLEKWGNCTIGTITGTKDWTYLSKEVDVPIGTTIMKISVYTLPNKGIVWFDDISVEKIPRVEFF